MTTPSSILIVDDRPQNIRLLEAILQPRGYRTVSADSGEAALRLLGNERPDLVLVDVIMPEMDGYELCRRLRADPATEFLPVVMITASDAEQRVLGIEAGADDFITKPFDQGELLGRVRSLLRIKHYHDTIQAQSALLEQWNHELNERVREQVCQLERATRLRRFLPPQLAELVIDTGDESFLDSHRCEVVVVFCDLRQFTRFSESSEPEEVLRVLNEYFAALGELVFRYGGTLERFTGDGLMVIFNDPMPCADAPLQAVQMAIAMRSRVRELARSWAEEGYELGFGVGVAQGFATLGRIGLEGRYEYTAIGSVVNLAARLCAVAAPWQILVTQRVHAGVKDDAAATPVGELDLRGFSRAVPAFDIDELHEPV